MDSKVHVQAWFSRIRVFADSFHKANAAIVPSRDLTRIAEGERVLVDGKYLTRPLFHGARTQVANGYHVDHSTIIGRSVATSFTVSGIRKGKTRAFGIRYPTLQEFISNAPRVVTPIYSSYCATIVDLLDFHVGSPSPSSLNEKCNPEVEILEAGTGNGSLTLHLARAIAAANPPVPSSILPEPRLKTTEHDDAVEHQQTQTSAEWRKTRRALIHTLDIYKARRIHAEKLIRSYRQALYWPHIDFYTGDVSHWLSNQLSQRFSARKTDSTSGFLTHVILDLPSPEAHLDLVTEAMKPGGKLICFAPSVTQIAEAHRYVLSRNLPLGELTTLELGTGISTGRAWDLRFKRRGKPLSLSSSTSPDISENSGGIEESARAEEQGEEAEEDRQPDTLPLDMPLAEDEDLQICRPKVGEKLYGGGFVGMWSKLPKSSIAQNFIVNGASNSENGKSGTDQTRV